MGSSQDTRKPDLKGFISRQRLRRDQAKVAVLEGNKNLLALLKKYDAAAEANAKSLTHPPPRFTRCSTYTVDT